MRITITVYDDNYRKVFSVVKVELKHGMFRLSSYLQNAVGAHIKVVETNKNGDTCHICKKPIKKGRGLLYDGRMIHQACLLAARQQLP